MMVDQDLRELERRAIAGGTEDGTALLRARMRTGAVSEEQITLAANLGDPRVRALRGLPAELEPRAIHQWVRLICPEGDDPTLLRVGLAASRAAVLRSGRGRSNLLEALTALEQLIVLWDRPSAQAIVRTWRVLGLDSSGRFLPGLHPLPWSARPGAQSTTRSVLRCTAIASLCAIRTGLTKRPRWLEGWILRQHERRRLQLVHLCNSAVEGVRDRGTVSRKQAHRIIRRAICDEVAPWVLGEGDPVAKRTAATAAKETP